MWLRYTHVNNVLALIALPRMWAVAIRNVLDQNGVDIARRARNLYRLLQLGLTPLSFHDSESLSECPFLGLKVALRRRFAELLFPFLFSSFLGLLALSFGG